MPFATTFSERRKACTSLCVGIDPSVEILSQWGLTPDTRGLSAFCDIMLSAIGENVAVVKPQSAFFEQFGPTGLMELQRICEVLRSRGLLVLVDCKRSDIGHSMEAYVRCYLGRHQHYAADAVTLNAFLGLESLHSAFVTADAVGRAVFVVISSSNPEGALLQSARMLDGLTIAETLADGVSSFNRGIKGSSARIGPCGAVCGLSAHRSPRELLPRLSNCLVLVPGLGAQGGTCEMFLREFDGHLDRAIPSIGRSIMEAGPDRGKIAEAIGHYKIMLDRTKYE